MGRISISATDYAAILDELVITGIHANAMSVTVGTHESLGRVVLLRSGTGYAIITDRLEEFARKQHTEGRSWTRATGRAGTQPGGPSAPADTGTPR